MPGGCQRNPSPWRLSALSRHGAAMPRYHHQHGKREPFRRHSQSPAHLRQDERRQPTPWCHPRVPNSCGALPIGPSLPGKRPYNGSRGTRSGEPFSFVGPRPAFDLGRVSGHAHMAAIGQFPAMQGVFLHGGHHELAVGVKNRCRYGHLPIPVRQACRWLPENEGSRHCSGQQQGGHPSGRRRHLQPSGDGKTLSGRRRGVLT